MLHINKTAFSLAKHARALVAVAVCSLQAAMAGEQASEILRVRVQNRIVLGEAELQNRRFADNEAAMAEFRRNVVTLPRNSSVQLTVELLERGGRYVDVTSHAATEYQSLSPAKLSVSSDGRVTAAPQSESLMGAGGDVAIVVVHDKPAQSAWNKIFFRVLP
ncbi:hypothetical protein [Noviherbaspirillum denitrificans]|uniref:Uncharacterized protein n=1 Tax=Noviherbaspirillum denitrificans TaxID=1968433 RepID=A0A254TKR7_9BURK|nr:hypothetical protein [Noviherbaspirillum denitrificans]OWW20308.1 hypothetical protein AYR66_13205 [Noviherbaspirillum denitrificans]